MFRSINRFVANTRGAFALQFAMMAIPLTVCTGLAIDGGRAFLARCRQLILDRDEALAAVGQQLAAELVSGIRIDAAARPAATR